MGELCGQEFSLGVCNLAAFDHGHYFAFLHAVAEPLAQLGNGPKQLRADAADAIGVWDDCARNLQPRLEIARPGLRHHDSSPGNLFRAEPDHRRIFLMIVATIFASIRDLLGLHSKADQCGCHPSHLIDLAGGNSGAGGTKHDAADKEQDTVHEERSTYGRNRMEGSHDWSPSAVIFITYFRPASQQLSVWFDALGTRSELPDDRGRALLWRARLSR